MSGLGAERSEIETGLSACTYTAAAVRRRARMPFWVSRKTRAGWRERTPGECGMALAQRLVQAAQQVGPGLGLYSYAAAECARLRSAGREREEPTHNTTGCHVILGDV